MVEGVQQGPVLVGPCATLFLKSASVALVCDFEFWCKNDDFSRAFVDS